MFDNPLNVGSRSTDTRSQVYRYNGSPALSGSTPILGSLTNLIDTQGFTTYNLQVFGVFLSPGTVAPPNCPAPTYTIRVNWYYDDGLGGFVAGIQEYFESQVQVNPSFPNSGLPLVIRNNCQARWMFVEFVGFNTPSASGPSGAQATLQLSSVPVPALTCLGTYASDGFIFDTGAITINSNASSANFCIPTAIGAMRLVMNANSVGSAGAQGRIFGGWGAYGANLSQVRLITAASLPTAQNSTPLIHDWPVAPPLPFNFFMSNIGTVQGIFSVQAYMLSP